MPDFDRDPEALAWARKKIQHHIDKAADFERQATAGNRPETASQWRRIKNYMSMRLIGGTGCSIASFDERLPEMRDLMDRAEDPA